jgi:cysteine desulfurase family protein (TIGR01976 family)
MTTNPWRRRFPGITGDWARFDGPAGTQAVDTAIDAMASYLRGGDNANAHGTFAASQATDALVASARHTVGRLLGADPRGVVFGPNMTSLLFAFTRAIGPTLGPGDEIVCTELDHDANVWPWVMAANDREAALVRTVRVDTASGRLDTEHLAELLNAKTRWLAITGASNAVGTMPDLAEAVKLAHAVGARVLVDAVHLVPHRVVDIATLGCDALACSPYKWYGPHAGVLWLDPDLLASLEPYKVRPAPDEGPTRLETGTPSYEAIAGAQAAAQFLLDEGLDVIAAHERATFAPLLDGLLDMDHVTVHGPHDLADRAPTVAFTVNGMHPLATAESLAAERIAVWSGNYYALELMTALGLEETGGAVRAGLACYTNDEDVNRLLEAVASLA